MRKNYSVIDEYMKMTGQTVQEVLAGVECYGHDSLYKLLKKCLDENKKIVWKDKHFINGIDATTYELVPVRRNYQRLAKAGAFATVDKEPGAFDLENKNAKRKLEKQPVEI